MVIEEQNQIQTPSKNELILTDVSISMIAEIAKWAKFLAIIGFVGIGLMVVLSFSIGTIFSLLNEFQQASPFPFPGFLFGFIYFIIAIIYFFPVLYLYRFSIHAKEALKITDNGLLEKALINLKAHYRYIGIVMIVVLAIYALALVIGIFVGIVAGIMG